MKTDLCLQTIKTAYLFHTVLQKQQRFDIGFFAPSLIEWLSYF